MRTFDDVSRENSEWHAAAAAVAFDPVGPRPFLNAHGADLSCCCRLIRPLGWRQVAEAAALRSMLEGSSRAATDRAFVNTGRAALLTRGRDELWSAVPRPAVPCCAC